MSTIDSFHRASTAPLEQPEPRRADSDKAKTATSRRRVLVVDDNVDSAATLSALLRHIGQETKTAHDGPQALEVADSYRPEIILLDIGMPGMNGYEVARRIRQQPWGAGMTLIAVTGWGQEEDKRQAELAGFDDHLTKPLELAAVRRIFELQRFPVAETRR